MAALALSAVGCVDLTVPDDAQLPCDAIGQCPPPLVCHVEAGRCINPAYGMPLAPSVEILPLVLAAGQRPVNRVDLDLIVADANAAPVGSDTVALTIEFTADDPNAAEATWHLASLHADSPATTALAADGEPVTMVWNALADADEAGSRGLRRVGRDTDGDGAPDAPVVTHTAGISIRVTPTDSYGLSGETEVVTLAVGDNPPAAVLEPFQPRNAQEVAVVFALQDTAGDLANVEVEFRLPGETAETDWRAAMPGSGSFVGLATAEAEPGHQHVVTWDSAAPRNDDDHAAPQGIGDTAVADIEVRLRPWGEVDGRVELYGEWAGPERVEVRNQTAPQVLDLEVPAAGYGRLTGPVAIHYRLADDEGDLADIQAHFSADGGTTWVPCAEYRSPLSEGLYDLETTATEPGGGGGLAHTFVWDPTGLVAEVAAPQVRIRATDGRSPTVGEAKTSLSREVGPADPVFALASFAATTNPRAGTVADFDADGILDLALVHADTDTVSIHLGNGSDELWDGSFGAATTFATGAGPTHVIAADFDRDGILDLAIGCETAQEVWVLAGNGVAPMGDGTFAAGVVYGLDHATGPVTAAHLDADEALDLVVGGSAFLAADGISVLFGNAPGGVPDGTFGAAVTVVADGEPGSFVVADLTGDQVDDIAYADGATDEIVLLPGHEVGGAGDGTFDAPLRTAVALRPSRLAAGHLDGDERLDLIYSHTNADAAALVVLRGRGTVGVGDEPFDAPLVVPVEAGLRDFALADVNGDGTLDVAGGFDGAGHLAQLVLGTGIGGRGDGGFAAPILLGPDSFTAWTLLADLNRDGVSDLVLGPLIGLTVSVLVSNPPTTSGLFEEADRASLGATPAHFDSGDFDEDGVVDLAVATGTEVRILLGSGVNGSGDGSFREVRLAPGSPSARSITTADLNADGHDDLVVPAQHEDTIEVLHGRGDGTFSPAGTYPSGIGPARVAVADFDGDGWRDLAAVNRTSDDLSFFLWDSSAGSFAPEVRHPIANVPENVVAADFNGDQILDLAVQAKRTPYLSLLIGTGDPSGTPFERGNRLRVGGPALNVEGADFNSDGLADLLVGGLFGEVTVALGQGEAGSVAGSAVPLPAITAGGYPAVVTAGDFNGDGATDAAVTDGLTNLLSILINDAPGGIGRGVLSVGPSLVTGSLAEGVIAADFNRDQILDLAVANQTSSELVVYRGARTRTGGWLEPLGELAGLDALRSRAVGSTTLPPSDELGRACATRDRRDRDGLEPVDGLCVTEQRSFVSLHRSPTAIRDAAATLRAVREAGIDVPARALPLTAPIRVTGDRRWRRVADAPTTASTSAGHRLRLTHAFGPLVETGPGAGIERLGLAATDPEPRALVLQLPLLPGRPATTLASANRVRLFQRQVDWVRASEYPGDALFCDPTCLEPDCVPPAWCECAGPACQREADLYLPRVPVAGATSASFVDRIRERHRWVEIPADDDGDLAADPNGSGDAGARFVASLSGPVATRRLEVLTDQLGLFQAFLEMPACTGEGTACDDRNPCSHTDLCSDQICAGQPYICADGNGATVDPCLGDGGCWLGAGRECVTPDCRCVVTSVSDWYTGFVDAAAGIRLIEIAGYPELIAGDYTFDFILGSPGWSLDVDRDGSDVASSSYGEADLSCNDPVTTWTFALVDAFSLTIEAVDPPNDCLGVQAFFDAGAVLQIDCR